MESIRVYCKNTDSYHSCKPGTRLIDFLNEIGYTHNTDKHGNRYPVLAAYVDNKLKELSYPIYMAHSIDFLDITHSDGRRTYVRSLNFLLQKAVNDVYNGKYNLIIGYSLPNGLYGELHHNNITKEDIAEFKEKGASYRPVPCIPDIVPVCDSDITKIKARMQELIAADFPFIKTKKNQDECISLFLEHRQMEKARLCLSLGNFFNSVYYLDGYGDTFYGPMLHSTGAIENFDLVKYNNGFCLQSPEPFAPYDLPKVKYQEKLYDIFKENENWCRILGANDIATVNIAVQNGYASQLIQIAEALHERKYAAIADMIYARRDRVKLVLLSGPSSSGKTTTSKRLAVQLKVLGLNPVVLEMDNYFVNRERTPKDEDGNYDFESIYAMDLELLNSQLGSLLAGEEVEVPKFNFAEGRSTFCGNRLKLGESDILIMEGIHALNPQLTASIDDEKKFRIHASALTSLSIDENNNISTTDNRMLRRMVRDNNFRGTSAEDTILRWNSVRRGEYRNIFPYQENADVMFNSSLIYELPLLKHYAEPLLRRISPNSPAYSESLRLLKFLSYITVMNPKEQTGIPPTSVMREFIGESTFTY
ncbi:MAG: nucleoside kinase [Bacteroidales bacterium]|nr:nucleoside kinase [Bacteroidales bacterium]